MMSLHSETIHATARLRHLAREAMFRPNGSGLSAMAIAHERQRWRGDHRWYLMRYIGRMLHVARCVGIIHDGRQPFTEFAHL